MIIEYYQSQRSAFPKARIRKNSIELNVTATKNFLLKNKQPVLMGYDKEIKTIYIKIVKEEVSGFYRLNIKNFHTVISCTGFMKYFGISPSPQKYDVWQEDDQLVFKIEDTKKENQK